MLRKLTRSNNHLIDLILRPQFAVFSLSVIFSQIAANMLNIVLIVLTYNITQSNFAVSILVMSFIVPQIIFSFLGGIVADAKNKRKILIIGNVSRAILLVFLFFVKDILAFIYIFMLLISSVTQFYVPAEAPIIPHLVKRSQLLAANAIFGICLFASILIGYILAGPAMRFFGEDGVFIFMALIFGVSYIFIQIMPDVAPATRKLRTEKTAVDNFFHLYRLVFKEFREVIGILQEKKMVSSSFVFLALSQVIILLLATIVPDYAQTTLHLPAEDISLIIFAPAAIGIIATSFLIGSKFSKVNPEKIIDFGLILSSIVLFLFAIIDLQNVVNVVILAFIVTLFAGVANASIFVPAQTIVQTHVSHKNLSKVYGLLFLMVGIFAFAPLIITGVFADFLGVRWVLLGISLALLILALVKKFVFHDKIKI